MSRNQQRATNNPLPTAEAAKGRRGCNAWGTRMHADQIINRKSSIVNQKGIHVFSHEGHGILGILLDACQS